LWNVDLADAFHPLFSFLLFFKQLAFAGDVAAVTLRGHVLTQSGDAFARDNLAADRRLDCNLVKLPRDDLLQFRGELASATLSSIAMDNGGESINRFAVHEQVEFNQLGRTMPGMLVIHRTVAAGDRLNLVVEIDQNLVQRQFAMQHDAPSVE